MKGSVDFELAKAALRDSMSGVTPLAQGIASSRTISQECGCIGPQRGEPLCPCQMAAYGVTVINGRYVQPARDLGPASTAQGPSLADLVKGQR